MCLASHSAVEFRIRAFLVLASRLIQQFLANQQSTQVLTSEMKRVRQAAEIEYLGEFAASSGNAAATGEAVDSEMQ